MKNTILRENMIRFRTKNLTESILHITKLMKHEDLLDGLDEPGQADSVYQTKIDELIQALGGVAAAFKVAEGSIDFISKMADKQKTEPGETPSTGDDTYDPAWVKKLIGMTPFEPADQAKLINDISALADKLKLTPQ